MDTRKSDIMKNGIKLGVKLINDVSGLSFDTETINVLKNKVPLSFSTRLEHQKICKKIQNIIMNY